MQEEIETNVTTMNQTESLKTVISELTVLASSLLDDPSSETRPVLPLSAEDKRSLLLKSTPLLAQLKSINRDIFQHLQSQKLSIADQRSKVDSARLSLQNLIYERNMLEGEIRRCQEFRSIYQDTDIHSLEEFMEKAPETERDQETISDAHKLMLSRLKFELEERKRLETEKQALQVDRATLVKENKEKKAKLEELEKRLKEILSSSKVLESSLETFQ
ncbi:hypothetical protein IE53DRAFT_385358 [Violaceomyces palustris]|uniref:Uncharacterized protein n=1 Tax=Violaceomyces palustris TaxID=1673888 RepID=A0ACD0P2T1_9BASI|nr:hypothetical protein IE53DRAFT_385358 [Violaceomyces palustris]